MGKSATFALMLAASLGLAACSEKTDDNAANTAASPRDDVQAEGAAGETAGEGAEAIGNAAAAAAASTDEVGNKAEIARAKIEAQVHDEPLTEAKRD